MDKGITATGFEPKQLDEIVAETQAQFISAFGENFSLPESSPDQRMIAAYSEALAVIWELLQLSYNSMDIDSAQDDTLTKLVWSLTRKVATTSKVDLLFGGVPGTVIPVGTRVTSNSDENITFVTTIERTVESGGTVTVAAECEVTGAVFAVAGTLTTVEPDSDIPGLSSVVNVADSTIGREDEKDPEFRARAKRSVAVAGRDFTAAIRAALFEISGVTSVTIVENDTDVDDAVTGVPKHSFEVIVTGGADQSIIDVIGAKKTPGIGAHGDVSGTYVDSQGSEKTVAFSRPSIVDIHVLVNIDTFDDFPSNGVTLIKEALVNHSQDFTDGEDVIYSLLYTPINTVPGISVTNLRVGVAPSPTGTGSVPVPAGTVARILAQNVEVV